MGPYSCKFSTHSAHFKGCKLKINKRKVLPISGLDSELNVPLFSISAIITLLASSIETSGMLGNSSGFRFWYSVDLHHQSLVSSLYVNRTSSPNLQNKRTAVCLIVYFRVDIVDVLLT